MGVAGDATAADGVRDAAGVSKMGILMASLLGEWDRDATVWRLRGVIAASSLATADKGRCPTLLLDADGWKSTFLPERVLVKVALRGVAATMFCTSGAELERARVLSWFWDVGCTKYTCRSSMHSGCVVVFSTE
jgi:hypothetical protein